MQGSGCPLGGIDVDLWAVKRQMRSNEAQERERRAMGKSQCAAQSYIVDIKSCVDVFFGGARLVLYIKFSLYVVGVTAGVA